MVLLRCYRSEQLRPPGGNKRSTPTANVVAVELKRGKFKPAYLGQLDFYLACLDKYVKREDENPSIGLLLCHEMNRSVVELTIGRYNSPLGVATYRTAEDVPDEYKTLRPLLDGAKKLLNDNFNQGAN